MLNKRQIGIVLELYENTGSFFTAAYFSRKNNAGLRTIQADIKAIKAELESIGCASIKSKKSCGSYLQIEDYDMFSIWVNNLYMQYTCSTFSYPL